MGIEFKASGVKLSNIKSFNSANTVSKDVFKNQFYEDLDEIDYSKPLTATNEAKINLQEGINEVGSNQSVLGIIGSSFATACVTATSVISGIAKIKEHISDGALWVGGAAASFVVGFFDKEAAKTIQEWTMDEIARDKVGELNKFIYEDTFLGNLVNNASYMKYDSTAAKTIQNVTTTATEVIGATAITVATGGTAAPFVVGGLAFAEGAGRTAEKKFQDTENRDFWKDSGEIFIDGAINAASSVATGKAGASLYGGAKTLTSIGMQGTKELAKSTLQKFGKDVFTNTIKDSGKQIVKNAAVSSIKESIIETACVTAEDVKGYLKTGDFDINKVIGKTASIYASNFVGNLGGEYLNIIDEANRAGTIADNWRSREGITDDIADVAENNYRNNSKKFTSKSNYYEDLDYVEAVNKDITYETEDGFRKTKNKRISKDDPGITRCLSKDGEKMWNNEVDKFTNKKTNTTRVHVGNTYTDVFDNYIVGNAADGYKGTGLGRAKDYNFASLGDNDVDGLIAKSKGSNTIHQFQDDLGLKNDDSKRVFLYDYDIPRDSAQMHTGKELGSNKYRLPGGATPDGKLELVHETISLDASNIGKSQNVNVNILDKDGNKLFSGSLDSLRNLKETDLKKYYDIIGK